MKDNMNIGTSCKISDSLPPVKQYRDTTGHFLLRIRRGIVASSTAALLASCGGGGGDSSGMPGDGGLSPIGGDQPNAPSSGNTSNTSTGSLNNGGVVPGSRGSANTQTLTEAGIKYTLVQNEIINRIRSIQLLRQDACSGAGTTLNQCIVESNDFSLPHPSSVGSSYSMQIAESLFGGYAENQVTKVLEEIISKYPDNLVAMYSIILEEQSHLIPPVIEDWFRGGSLGLSQIQVNPGSLDRQMFGFTDSARLDLLDPIKHLALMNERIEKIKNRMITENIPFSMHALGRTWNGGYNCLVQNQYCSPAALAYGNRVQQFADRLLEYLQLHKGN